jgi:3-deoxy-D-manno-octulosonic-acid transferase
MAHEEYLRRNLIHAASCGSKAAFEKAIKRLSETKNPPKWLMETLQGGLERAERVCPEMAKWRNAAPDAPYYATPEGKD